MYSTRATILANRFLIRLSKVCSPRNSTYAVKSLTLLRNLSTTAERSDFQNANGYYVDSSFEHQKTPSGYYSESLNPTASPLKSPGSVGGFRWRNYGVLRENSNEYVQHSTRFYRQSFRRAYQSSPVEKEGTLSGNTDQNGGTAQQNLSGFCANNSRAFDQNSSGFRRNNSDVYGEIPINGMQSNRSQQNGNFSGLHDSNREFRQNNNGVYAPSTMSIQHSMNALYGANRNVQHSYGSYQERPGEMRENPYGTDPHGLSESQGSLNWNYQNFGQAQQTAYGQNTGNVGVKQQSHSWWQQSRSFGQYHQQSDSARYPPNFNAFQNTFENDPFKELDMFCKKGKVKEAVEVLWLLEKKSIPVDLPRYSKVMLACGKAQSLPEAKSVHEHILRTQSPLKLSSYNKIIEMYWRCGSMDDAISVFDTMPKRNLTSWDVMITWLAKNGLGEDAIDLFTKFKETGLKPDGQMFIGVLSACSVLGDVEEGMLHFESMSKDYGIVPSMNHYVSVVDMLGSVGHLDEAFEFIEKMSLEASVDVLETLMNLCRVHGHLELGDRCAEIVEQLESSRLNEQSKAGLLPVKPSNLAKQKEKKKLGSQNPLGGRNRVQEYRAGDRSHPNDHRLYAELRALKVQMKESGYKPDLRFVLHDIDDESKEEALIGHSERLAAAYGLINSPARSSVRIIKNLRICGDCHTAMKIISKLVGRELVVRDAKRFHHFKDGLCSCRDYW